MDKMDAVFIILALILVAIFVLYIFFAYRRRWPPFQEFTRIPPPDTFLINVNPRSFTQAEIDARLKNAAILCEAAANTTNFMTDYCGGEKLDAGGIDCSGITSPVV